MLIIKFGFIIKLLIFASIVVATAVVTSAYSNGRDVIDKPQVQWVSHTEYWSSSGVGSGGSASTIVRLTDYKGNPFSVDSCTVTILYPNKLAYISNAALAESAIPGNWFRTDPVPDMDGTYEQEVTCTYGGGKTIITAESFHVNPALNFVKNVSAQTLLNGVSLTDVNLTILGKIEGSNSSIVTQIVNTETKLNSLLNDLNVSLSEQLTAAKVDLNSNLQDVNFTLNARIGQSQTAIQTQLSNTESNLDGLIDSVNASLQSYLATYLPAIKTTTDNIYTDSQWLVTNAMNQQDSALISNRFNLVDGNISLIEDFCSNTQTTGSGLCTEIDSIGIILNLTRAEQTTYYERVESNVTSTWNLLSGDITTNINSILSTLNIIQSQTTQINNTVEAIRTDQTSEVRIRAIS